MCGICGKIDLRGHPIPRELITKMTDSLSSRGPDDQGIYESKTPVSISLGHRRLSIVDVSPAGRQPMSNENNDIWLIFNGEIYNHQYLRRSLEAHGHRFTSKTDSEVILHLYEDMGIDCLKELNGMFAFCLWDSRTQTMFLCRDRAGIKPLVYAWDRHTLIFASEIRSLMTDPSVSREMDLEALDLYLTFNYIPSPHTIYKNIRKLNPATYLILKDNQIHLKTYWDPKPRLFSPIIAVDAKEKISSLLEESVRLQSKADVPWVPS